MILLNNCDCLQYMKTMDDGSVDLVVTDPPYIIENKGGGIYRQSDKKYIKELENIKDGFSKEILDELCRIMKKINIYIFCSQAQIIPLLQYFVENKKCNFNILTWHKTNPVPACGNKYLTDTEFILFFREKGVKLYGNFYTKKTYYVTPINITDKRKYKHPTIKPLDILDNFIVNSSLEGEVVFDPFMGSGSTGVSAVKNNRSFIGIEIEKQYFDIAKQRMYETETSAKQLTL